MWETPISFPGHSLLDHSGHRRTMIMQQWWVILAAEFIRGCLPRHFSSLKRQCVFHVKRTANSKQNNKYLNAGNVSGSVQVCENTHCCVGYFLVINGQPVVDLLACDVAEKSCPDATCNTQTRFNRTFIKCVCSTDLCNNATWTTDPQQPQSTHNYFIDEMMKVAVVLFGSLLILFFVIAATKWRNLKDKKNPQACHLGCSVSSMCSCQTNQTKNTEVDIADIELQQILGLGHFATVWQGKYRGSTVAVKVFPAGWKHMHAFTAEKEVYELPMMKHAGILHFLGTTRKPDDSSWLIVLQFAESGSLHSFLGKHTASWKQSLKLCQSLSLGLSYLHSDLRRHDVHKPPVAHRDLSSSNVLVKADGTCALSDFGCSTILRSFSGQHSWQSPTDVKGYCQSGTLRYMAPEILEGAVNLRSRCCLLQGDIYALGLLLWEIWMRCTDLFEGRVVPQHLLPYDSELGGNLTLKSIFMYVYNMEKRPSIPKHWELLAQGSALQELLTDCWDFDPEARLTAHCVVDRLVSLS